MIKLFELFAGIGAPRKALEKAGIDYVSLGYSEIDENAIKCYCAIHDDDPSNNYGDISKIDKLPKNIDLLFHGSPCQDFSLAGKRQGGERGSDTRSSLMWETVRLIEDSKPKIVIWENVLGALSGEMQGNFLKYLTKMEDMGYTNTSDVLTGTDFNIPQIRKRIFVISFLDENDFKNINDVKKMPLNKKLIDLLENDVNEKYFLSDEKLAKIDIKNKRLNYYNYDSEDRFNNVDDITSAIRTKQQTKVLIPEKTKNGYKEAKVGDGIYLDRLHQKRGTVQNEKIPTLKTSGKDLGIIDKNYRVRYLTPKEYYRLMGFTDEDYNKSSEVISESALYKTAGNSIIVDVLVGIFNLIYNDVKEEINQTKLF